MVKVNIFVQRFGGLVLEWVYSIGGRVVEKHEVEDMAVRGLGAAVGRVIADECKGDVPGHGLKLDVDRSSKQFRVEVILCQHENCLICAKAVERNLFMPGNTRWISVPKQKSAS